MEFHRVNGDYYEAVFVRKPDFERWQQIFQVYPELEVFNPKDLFAPHPIKPGCWKYVGRTDDLVILFHGDCVYVPAPEYALLKYPGVAAVLVGGQGLPRPICNSSVERHQALGIGQPARFRGGCGKFSKSCSDLIRLNWGLVLFTGAQRPLARTAKSTVARREAEKVFAEDIKTRYT